MQRLNLRTKALGIATLFVILIGATTLYIISTFEQSTQQIIQSNEQLTQAAAHQLVRDIENLLRSLKKSDFFNRSELTRIEEKRVDSILTAITSSELSFFEGAEGGYYFTGVGDFLGYAYPTSPAPKPAFGPPPRSYQIIKDQILETVLDEKQITRLHQFDPAIFPLTTIPLQVDGEIVGAAWARTHIERSLPIHNLSNIFAFAALFSLLAFAIAIFVSWSLRKRVEEIRLGLEQLEENPSFRFQSKRGVFGTITRSINKMVDALARDQREREELERELQQRAKLAGLGKLVARVAHEVKTPLANIKTRMQMWQRKLQKDSPSEEPSTTITEPSLRLVLDEINRLSDLVKRLLVFSRPVAQRKQPSDVNRIIEQVLALIQPDAENKLVTLEAHLTADLPQPYLDPTAIEQVILNICTNAFEATPAGGQITMRSEFHPATDSVHVVIQDTGSGISVDKKEKIFEPFFTTKEHGAGLGLSISYEIIRSHGGTLEFLQHNGEGTICQITLPLHPLNQNITTNE
ncbi:MAG: ATP-binding protein [bacterium]